MQFNREGIKPVYPEATHSKKGKGGLPYWNPVRPCLDLDDEGESVLSFELRKSGKNKGKLVPRIESENTIDRLIAGCKRHVLATGEPNFFQQGYTGDPHDKSPGIDTPSRAITGTGGNLYLAKAHMIDHYFGNGYMKSIDVPANTVGTTEGNALHTVQFLGTYHSIGDGTNLLGPCPAIMTKDKYPLFTAKFIDEQYSSGQQHKSIEKPASAIVGNPKQRVVSVDHILMDTQYQDNNGHRSRTLEQTCGTLTANRKSYYLVNFQWYNAQLRSVDKEAYTLIARQDKQPNYLITLETGELAIEIFEHDPPHYVKLKKFMAENGIVAINMRMLKEVEMLRIMTIPENSQMSKNSTDNKKMIGNAVPSKLIVHLGLAYDKQAA
jgi:DNA (cytosine-5)-methyltransferase 1